MDEENKLEDQLIDDPYSKNLNPEKDMIFYEYDPYNKQPEWTNNQARKFNMCLCPNYLFVIIGNVFLIFLCCSASAILLYFNTPTDITYAPLNYSQVCTNGSNNCDFVRNLYCNNGVCGCISNMYWNGTDCTCTTNQYWDGISCLIYPGYQQICSTSLPCFKNSTLPFVCDSLKSICLCPSTSTSYYTSFYTGGLGNLYGGTCLPKNTYNQPCSTYGVLSCQEYIGLTCSNNSLGNLVCQCQNGYYWNLTTCVPLLNAPGISCASNPTSSCNGTAGLSCNGALQCSCATNYFFNNNGYCEYVHGYAAACYSNSWCNSALSLTCNLAPGTCNCPSTSVVNICDCSSVSFWNGQTCTAKLSSSSPCPGAYACLSGTCTYGFCV